MPTILIIHHDGTYELDDIYFYKDNEVKYASTKNSEKIQYKYNVHLSCGPFIIDDKDKYVLYYSTNPDLPNNPYTSIFLPSVSTITDEPLVYTGNLVIVKRSNREECDCTYDDFIRLRNAYTSYDCSCLIM